MTRASDYGITVLRVTLGVIFLMHGYLGFFVFTPGGMTAFNASKGIPLPAITAWFVIFGHFLGGASLVFGLLTRLGALVHVVIMGGAVFFVHLAQGFFMHGIIVDAATGPAPLRCLGGSLSSEPTCRSMPCCRSWRCSSPSPSAPFGFLTCGRRTKTSSSFPARSVSRSSSCICSAAPCPL